MRSYARKRSSAGVKATRSPPKQKQKSNSQVCRFHDFSLGMLSWRNGCCGTQATWSFRPCLSFLFQQKFSFLWNHHRWKAWPVARATDKERFGGQTQLYFTVVAFSNFMKKLTDKDRDPINLLPCALHKSRPLSDLSQEAKPFTSRGLFLGKKMKQMVFPNEGI